MVFGFTSPVWNLGTQRLINQVTPADSASFCSLVGCWYYVAHESRGSQTLHYLVVQVHFPPLAADGSGGPIVVGGRASGQIWGRRMSGWSWVQKSQLKNLYVELFYVAILF